MEKMEYREPKTSKPSSLQVCLHRYFVAKRDYMGFMYAKAQVAKYKKINLTNNPLGAK